MATIIHNYNDLPALLSGELYADSARQKHAPLNLSRGRTGPGGDRRRMHALGRPPTHCINAAGNVAHRPSIGFGRRMDEAGGDTKQRRVHLVKCLLPQVGGKERGPDIAYRILRACVLCSHRRSRSTGASSARASDPERGFAPLRCDPGVQRVDVRMNGVEVRLRSNGIAGLVREVAGGTRAAA